MILKKRELRVYPKEKRAYRCPFVGRFVRNGVLCLGSFRNLWGDFGAGDRIRTGDIDLGKVALYQLSYSRFVTKR
jgi:hypothetical protein